MKKRILIDATTVIEKKDGLSQYIISLLGNLPVEAFDEFNFLVLINMGVKRKELWDVINTGKFEIIETHIAPIGPKRDWDFFFFFRRFKNNFDLFHSTSNQYPLFLKNGVATVHDITFKKYLDSSWWTFNMASRYLNLVIRRALMNAAAVIAVSNYTRQDLVRNYHVDITTQQKIKVIYEGWEHLQNNEADAETEILPAYNNYLFYVGTTRLHKNMKNLLAAFQIASTQLPEDIKLVISGNETYLDEADKNIIATINKKTERIIFTGFVSKVVLEHLFKNAKAFIFPSLSEGFGIPVLESFYFDKPLLCSNTTSLPEIAGDAALYFDPEKPEHIAEVILYFFNNPGKEKELVAKGAERLKIFSWKKAALETIALYKNVLENTDK
ncbi:MAG: glycosyltransferase family 1 protein [Ferruginibacter sp.]